MERRKRTSNIRPRLTIPQILHWADEWYANTGEWPHARSGWIPGTDEKWLNIYYCLSLGQRGLPGGMNLGKLLAERRGVRARRHLPALTESLILMWADAHHARSGTWPTRKSGGIPRTRDETWADVDRAMRRATRGLPHVTTLSRFLAEHRGVSVMVRLPTITEEQILGWVDSHHSRTGEWPRPDSGPVTESPELTWMTIDKALKAGRRGLEGRSSLVRLLSERRGVRNRMHLPDLSIEQILSWADAYREQYGKWPVVVSGKIDGEEMTWRGVHMALTNGGRGLLKGSSLAKLLSEHRGARNIADLPVLSLEQILAWADAHHARTGKWPNANSGAIDGTAGDTWRLVGTAMRTGLRGLSSGLSLAILLREQRGVKSHLDAEHLSEAEILTWADAHHARTGKWPTLHSGDIPELPGTNWNQVGRALSKGMRGLPGGKNLGKFLFIHRGVRNQRHLEKLTESKIIRWAKLHQARTGKWPNINSGAIPESYGITWGTLNAALEQGRRGLPGGSSLFKLLQSRGLR